MKTFPSSSPGVLCASVVILLLTACNDTRAYAPGEVAPLSHRFNPVEQPFAHVLPQFPPVRGVPGTGRASDCGTCHTQIYAEWKLSTHASALHDLQFQAELHKPDSPRWLCLNCHIPVQNQRETIVTGLYGNDVLRPATADNPGYDAKMQAEGVTCAACHVRVDAATGTSHIVGPNGSKLAPHPVRQDRAELRDTCARCHNPRGEAVTANLVCWFETFKELDDAAPGHTATTSDCVDCHMPAEERRAVPAWTHVPVREGRQHHWAGGGVPKRFNGPGGFPGLAGRGYEPALAADFDYDAGSRHLNVRLENVSAGHYLPTADPERFLLVLAYLEDRAERRIPGAERRYRIGQTWEWNPARKIADNRLKFGERRNWSPEPFPAAAVPQAVRLVLVVYHVKLTGENARYAAEANVDDGYMLDAPRKVAALPEHYPMAGYVYRASLDLQSGRKTVASLEELLRLSKAEQGRPLEERDY